jgi:small subunit ribosomal protein S15
MPQLAVPKQEIIAKFSRQPVDTGSSEVQIAILTERINHLNEHLKTARKDHAALRGLHTLVGRRSSLLRYLRRCDRQKYLSTISALGLRR